MPLTLEHLSTIEADAARIRAACELDRDARIPWSDRWTVGSVARHVAGAHHVVARIIHGRPTADFGLLESLDQPPKGDPGFPAWFADGTAALCDAFRSAGPDEPCWTSIPAGRGVRYWLRRLVHEGLVHRWDAELGVGWDHAPLDAAVAADGVDEFLTLALPFLRAERRSPAGPPVHISATDAEGSWFIQLADDGGCTVRTAAVPVAGTLQGPAAELLLLLYGRQSLADADVEVGGDEAIFEQGGGVLLPG